VAGWAWLGWALVLWNGWVFIGDRWGIVGASGAAMARLAARRGDIGYNHW